MRPSTLRTGLLFWLAMGLFPLVASSRADEEKAVTALQKLGAEILPLQPGLRG